MSNQALKIAKALRQVSMWVHPEGQINGSIFVTIGEDSMSQEDPKHVLNNDAPFLVLRKEKTDTIGFYNRRSIVRVVYDEKKPPQEDLTYIPCTVSMMDGSVIDGEIIEDLPAEYSRLYDYLNQAQDRFIRLFTDDTQVCMVNKSYIVKVATKQN